MDTGFYGWLVNGVRLTFNRQLSSALPLWVIFHIHTYEQGLFLFMIRESPSRLSLSRALRICYARDTAYASVSCIAWRCIAFETPF